MSEHENREDVFFNQSRCMNTTFRYNSLHVRLQMLAASYSPAFDGIRHHCKTGSIILQTSSENVSDMYWPPLSLRKVSSVRLLRSA